MNNPKEINVDSMLIAIASIIRERKEHLHMTVDDIVKKSGVSKGVISDLMTNRGRVPSLTNFIKIALALELPEDIFTSLIQGSIEKAHIKNNCTSEDVQQVLLRYGLKKEHIPYFMAQLDAIIQTQCSSSYKKMGLFPAPPIDD